MRSCPEFRMMPGSFSRVGRKSRISTRFSFSPRPGDFVQRSMSFRRSRFRHLRSHEPLRMCCSRPISPDVRIQDMMIEDISRLLRDQPPRAVQRTDLNRAGQMQSRQVAGSSSPGSIQTRTWTTPSRTRASIIRRFRRAGSALASPVRASKRPWCNGHSMNFPSK